jgi:glycosyltransferase involved in cell wall biosynthesis
LPRPDLIHGHVFRVGAVAAVLGRLMRVPVVVSEHHSLFARRLATPTDLLLARIAFRGAHVVAPVSESLRESIEAYGIHARFRVVPNPVDTALFHPGERRSGDLRLLNVAALAEKKRHADLLEAVALLRARGLPVTLDIVGDGELAGELAACAGEGVRLLGARPPAAVAELMRAADLFVLPSRFENLPVVLLEALASGLPVVATAVGGVPEIVDDAAGRLVAPDDPAALADAIADVAARTFDPAALAGRVRERYSLEAVGATWDEIYAELTHRPVG